MAACSPTPPGCPLGSLVVVAHDSRPRIAIQRYYSRPVLELQHMLVTVLGAGGGDNASYLIPPLGGQDLETRDSRPSRLLGESHQRGCARYVSHLQQDPTSARRGYGAFEDGGHR